MEGGGGFMLEYICSGPDHPDLHVLEPVGHVGLDLFEDSQREVHGLVVDKHHIEVFLTKQKNIHF